MMQSSKTMMWPFVGLFLLLPACGDDGGGGSSGGGGGGGTDDGGGTGGDGDSGADDESGDGSPPDPGPNEHGDQCGGDVRGWETRCLVEELEAVASDRGEIPGVPPTGEHTQRALCCEGQPSVETADAGCHGYCMLELCEAALADHISRCDTCLGRNCGFDMTDCLDGGAHTQTFACLAPLGGNSYTLTASCSAINNEKRNPDGTFFFLQQPLNDTNDDPDICMPPDNLELDPPRGLGQFTASAGEGTVARVSWSLADMSGEESSDDLEVLFQYGIMPCATPSSDCLELTALKLTLPTTTAMGMTITNARLSVVAIEDAPVLERGERFSYPEGTIRVLMQAHVNGFPLVLTGTNVGSPSGRVSPEGDQFSFSGLRFEFVDSVITAALEIEIQGQYDARRPNAQITRSTAPESCDEPVTLLATSWDSDQDALSHTWWVRDIGSFTGPLLEVLLPAGEYDVMLTSRDPSGLVDSATLRYARTCR
jgi:hypothetical protein